MVKGNLLLESETFRLTDEELPMFAERMEALQLLINDYVGEYDSIYGTGDLSRLPFRDLMFYELGYIDLPTLQNIIPNFSNDIQKTIIRLIGHDDKCSTNLSSTLGDLNTEFSGRNNGLLGLQCERFPCSPEFTVFHEKSWYEWKIAYLTKYPKCVDWSKVTHPYLPNLSYSNTLLEKESQRMSGEATCKKFYDYAGKMAGGSKNALAIEVGGIIAKSNFYQYDDAVSKKNQGGNHLRNIYVIEKEGRSLYLSIDVEKASFEVCDHDGRHQGEYLFDGTKHQDADKSGRHDIKVR